MSMKFVALVCRCGLDLTSAEPVNVIEPEDAEPYGECPDCGRTYLVKPEPEPEPPKITGRRRRVSKPEPEPTSEE